MPITLKKPSAGGENHLLKQKGWMTAEPKPAKPPKPVKKQHDYSLDSHVEFRGWTTQKPDLAKVFGVIKSKWRASRTLRPGVDGYWAAWTLDEWCKWTGMKRRTLQLKIDELVAIGMIERGPGRHGGSRVLMHYRPTPKALFVIKGGAADWHHLGLDPQDAEPDKKFDDLLEGYKAAYTAKTGFKMIVVPQAERKALRAILTVFTDARQIIEICFSHWSTFCEYVAEEEGYSWQFAQPESPRARHVEKHLQLAAEFLNSQAADASEDGGEEPASGDQ